MRRGLVTRERIGFGALLAAVALGALIVAAYGKASSSTAARVGVALVLGLIALRMIQAIGDRRAEDSAGFDHAARSRPPEPPFRPDSLKDMESVVKSSPSARHCHRRVRPVLRGIARERLRAHRVELDGPPELPRRMLGEQFYELVRPGRPMPGEGVRGLTTAELTSFIETLEAL